VTEAAGALTVALTGLEVYGRHGVLAAETALGQRFVVDIVVHLASAEAATTDRLDDTVDYAALADRVAAIVAGEPVALIERLAGRIADAVLATPPAVAVEVTVHKPHVALPHTVSETAVTLRRP
jgi:7,8-dihydroneopterin aldolase/epimerase/oxygenase